MIAEWNKDTIELQEEFKLLLLNRASEILGVFTLSKGGTYQTIVDLRLLFSVVLKSNASSVILSHNHPTGHLKPSNADKNITDRIIKASKLLDIRILDHIILSKDTYVSMLDSGLM